MPEYADIGDQHERKITGIDIYESQIDRLFQGTQEMARQVRAYARKVSLLGGGGGPPPSAPPGPPPPPRRTGKDHPPNPPPPTILCPPLLFKKKKKKKL